MQQPARPSQSCASMGALLELKFQMFCGVFHDRADQVTEMQVLIEAAPVPSFVADRLVRKIVHEWVFHSDEKLPFDLAASDNIPMLRKRS